ncbi:MAG: bifunctional ADP-dependent NAD(P)H-hydrate dehydratase/NAD(P)H-hydrate epimerase [Puniceicoccaceae bacterium]
MSNLGMDSSKPDLQGGFCHSDHLHPILSCQAASALETSYFKSGLDHEAAAMERAGRAVALAIEQSWGERFPHPEDHLPILLLVGKGHNTGDACLAAMYLALRYRQLRFFCLLLYPPEEMRPLTRAAFERFSQSTSELTLIPCSSDTPDRLTAAFPSFDGIVLDGFLGFNFRPPLSSLHADLLQLASRIGSEGIRYAVDLPSGLGDPRAFRADFTIATGIVKEAVLDPIHKMFVGRLRYADIGFFADRSSAVSPTAHWVISPTILNQLRHLRPPQADKRDFGRIAILAGSDSMPGALIMTVRAALKAGGGLVTGFSTASALRAAAPSNPEAMWSENFSEINNGFEVLVIGPGLQMPAAAIFEVASNFEGHLVLDAAGLDPDIINHLPPPESRRSLCLTPHPGELLRLFRTQSVPPSQTIREYCQHHQAILVSKDASTRVYTSEMVATSPHGGPILARGGSGDCLAGIISALLPRFSHPLPAVLAGVAWQGATADYFAGTFGAEGCSTCDWLSQLSGSLRQPPLAIYPPLPKIAL